MWTIKRCGLCGGDPGASGYNRVGGLDICDGCLHGDMSTRLKHMGIVVDGKAVQVARSSGSAYDSGDPHIVVEIEVGGTCPNHLPIGLAFSREGFTAKIAKLFTKEIQVGDPLFDDFIYIRCSGDEDIAERFLADEGVQTAIMELVGPKGHVTIEGGQIGVFTEQDDYSAFDRCRVAVACLLARIMQTS